MRYMKCFNNSEGYIKFAASRGLNLSKGANRPHRLSDVKVTHDYTYGKGGLLTNPEARTQCSYGHGDRETIWTWIDHTTMWTKDGKAVLYLSEPYGVSSYCSEETLKLCEFLDLTCVINAPGPDSLW